ncbi:MAG: Cysteine--tRNA ligase [Candidatus Tokpelaia hoelldobleri]|uniref:Cysteine--tRNA ligase n=1 Tax=Candidatus Tokpelaia hoelldobleri TaxID=1902579 RepID=A0A1U9JVM5_9HYPH|nr:MAG: Cysteine--tRNA ligase [Candidatus Tokpelaia hoelldoblerii]
MTALRFYNTLTRKKDDFQPIDAGNVRLYVCGPTVYDYAHIGNARPVIVFDVLYRLLRHVYGKNHVLYARNITDVDDKINARAVRDYPGLPLNEAIRRLTEATNAQFQADVAALGCLPPDVQPRATDHLDDMRAMIERLVENGHAYVAENHVLFSVASMGNNPRYGALSHRSPDDMLAGARVDVADYKRDEMDFVLWKPSKEGEPGWPSPAGIAVSGRPGWHIECSAMSMARLLMPFGGGLACDDPVKNVFDIHGGGIDLVFPHHENEIAQSCSAFGSPRMANLWMHNGFLQVEGQKMSKSLGNFITIRDVLREDVPQLVADMDEVAQQRWVGLAARFSMLQTHYREPVNWTRQRLVGASEELYRWYGLLRESGFDAAVETGVDEGVIAALADDLNTWNAITALRRFYKARNAQALGAGMALVGLVNAAFIEQEDHPLFVRRAALPEAEILARIDERLAAIAAKDWAQADRIRDALKAKGIVLEDGKDPETGERFTRWDIAR